MKSRMRGLVSPTAGILPHDASTCYLCQCTHAQCCNAARRRGTLGKLCPTIPHASSDRPALQSPLPDLPPTWCARSRCRRWPLLARAQDRQRCTRRLVRARAAARCTGWRDRSSLRRWPGRGEPAGRAGRCAASGWSRPGPWFICQPGAPACRARPPDAGRPAPAWRWRARIAARCSTAPRRCFAEVGLRCCYGDAQTWFLRAHDWPRPQTPTADAAMRHGIDDLVPQGGDGAAWRSCRTNRRCCGTPIRSTRRGKRGDLRRSTAFWPWGGGRIRQRSRRRLQPCRWPARLASVAGWRSVPASSRMPEAAGEHRGAPPWLAVLDSLAAPALAGGWRSGSLRCAGNGSVLVHAAARMRCRAAARRR